MDDNLILMRQKQEEYLQAARYNYQRNNATVARQYAREVLFIGNKIKELTDETNPVIADAYLNMAFAQYMIYFGESARDKDIDDIRKALSYAEKALNLDPVNQDALAAAAEFLVILWDLSKAAEKIDAMTIEGFSQRLLFRINSIIENIRIYASSDLYGPAYRKEAMDTFFCSVRRKIVDDTILNREILIQQAQCYLVLCDYIDAYAILQEVLKDKPVDSGFFSAYLLMCKVCCNPLLKKSREAVYFGDLAIRFLNEDAAAETRADAISVFGLALSVSGDTSGLAKCSEAVRLAPCDITYYNFARALYELHRYEEALPWARKAYLICTDEMNCILVADMYRELGECNLAVEYYEKAIQLMSAQHMLRMVEYETDGIIHRSYASVESIMFFFRYALLCIIRLYMKAGELQKAKAYVLVAVESFPDDKEFDIVMDALLMVEVSQGEVEKLNQKLFTAEREMLRQRKMSKELVIKLISIQDDASSMDLDNYEDWEVFSERIDGVIRKLEQQASGQKRLKEDVRNRLVSQYPFLAGKALQFLITAEVLYNIHKGTDIDFACILIEYIKACELLLRNRLAGFLSPKTVMLGDVINQIKNLGISPYSKWSNELDKINQLRRSSAHTGLLIEKDVETIQDIYFRKGFLNVFQSK